MDADIFSRSYGAPALTGSRWAEAARGVGAQGAINQRGVRAPTSSREDPRRWWIGGGGDNVVIGVCSSGDDDGQPD